MKPNRFVIFHEHLSYLLKLSKLFSVFPKALQIVVCIVVFCNQHHRNILSVLSGFFLSEIIFIFDFWKLQRMKCVSYLIDFFLLCFFFKKSFFLCFFFIVCLFFFKYLFVSKNWQNKQLYMIFITVIPSLTFVYRFQIIPFSALFFCLFLCCFCWL